MRQWHSGEETETGVGVSEELKSHQMLGTPQGLNRHIKHNITSCTGVQSLVHSRELLHYVLLPQFKSREVKSNALQTGGGGVSPLKEYTGDWRQD